LCDIQSGCIVEGILDPEYVEFTKSIVIRKNQLRSLAGRGFDGHEQLDWFTGLGLKTVGMNRQSNVLLFRHGDEFPVL
jgi:hypothetical protein